MYSVYSVDDISYDIVHRIVTCDVSDFLVKSNDRSSSKGLMFFQESSTRTKESFKLAFDSLDVFVSDINLSVSSVNKGETLLQTIETFSYYVDSAVCVLRSALRLPRMNLNNVAFINAGDGVNEHPTQALGDFLTIYRALGYSFSERCLSGVRVTIVGDIENSRVVRSNVKLLSRFGSSITLVVPSNMISHHMIDYYQECFGCEILFDLSSDVIERSDFLMFLRTQVERLSGMVTSDISYFSLNDRNIDLVGDKCFIMHPGPVNIGKELSYDAYSHVNSLIEDQVKNALTVRTFLIDDILRV